MIRVTNMQNWIGTSGDVKPTTSEEGLYFEETDTGNVFRWAGKAWHQITFEIDRVTKPERKDMFNDIVTQLKIANIHLASLSGEEVTTMDID